MTLPDMVPEAVIARPKLTRPGWATYFLDIAEVVATRADCTRRQVGAVIVDQQRRIVATGYNGSPPRGPSCLAGECPRGRLTRDELPGYAEGDNSYDLGPGTCVALHAEQNSVMYCSMDQRRGATLFVTAEPCGGCWRMLGGSGIETVYWPDESARHGYLIKRLERGVWV